jgi:hypothetical protein
VLLYGSSAGPGVKRYVFLLSYLSIRPYILWSSDMAIAL